MRDHEIEAQHRYVIAVGIDFSSPSSSALALAQSIAHRKSASVVHVVHVACLPDPSEDTVHMDMVRELERVRGVCAPVARELGACVECHVLIGRAEDELVRFACDCGADVLILGGREKSSLQRFLGGSITRRIARSADCSVLVARESDATYS
ncbi:MAG: universal stress protein [Polyangiaceae bacterium]